MSIESECEITAQERALRVRRHELRMAQWRLDALRERQASELQEAMEDVLDRTKLVEAHEKHLADTIREQDSEKAKA